MKSTMTNELGVPAVVDRSIFQAELDALRVREKAHRREGDAMAAARRRLPMVEVDGTTPLIGERGALTLLDAFGGRRLRVEAMDNSNALLDLTVYGRQGVVGGLAERLAAKVEKEPIPYRWTSRRPVAPPEGRAFRRSGSRVNGVTRQPSVVGLVVC